MRGCVTAMSSLPRNCADAASGIISAAAAAAIQSLAFIDFPFLRDPVSGLRAFKPWQDVCAMTCALLATAKDLEDEIARLIHYPDSARCSCLGCNHHRFSISFFGHHHRPGHPGHLVGESDSRDLWRAARMLRFPRPAQKMSLFMPGSCSWM